MKTNVTIFGGIGLFVLIIAFVYGFVTDFNELAGFPLLLLTAGLGFMLWWYLRGIVKKQPVMDGDKENGEISDMHGTYGDFAPWSWWPIGFGAAAAAVFGGIAIDWWVFLFMLIPTFFFVTGLIMEFNRKRYVH